jgi:GntR family transcriptional repressor for pyruvate dehydrogenase complex
MYGLMKIIGEMLYKETNRIIGKSRYTRENTIETTRDLVQAIKQRDAEKAKELMGEHIRDVKVSLE